LATISPATSDCRHLAGGFEAGEVGGVGRRRVGAHALQHVGAVDAGSGDLDEDFLGLELRQRTLGDLQDLGAAGLADLDDPHLGGELHEVDFAAKAADITPTRRPACRNFVSSSWPTLRRDNISPRSTTRTIPPSC
jgi:hypothetical protein